MTESARIETLAVHAGYDPSENHGSATPPLYQTATFVAADTEALEAVNSGRARGFVYSRIHNPTVLAAEQRIARLEGAESAALFSSGMAAVSGALEPLLSASAELVATPDIYGGSIRYFTDSLPRHGVTVRPARSIDPQDVAACAGPKAKVIYTETPANPLLRMTDVAALSRVAKGIGALLVVDGTLGGPFNQKPLEFGANIVVHSASKYLNGHGDLVAGAIIGTRSHTRAARRLQQLLLRGMTTSPLRMMRHNRNGERVATFMSANAKVLRVHYPGLPGHPDHDIARRKMTGFGALMSFDLPNDASARRVVDACRIFRIGPSLGGVESLISQPGNTSHHSVPRERRRSMGISDRLVRLSVGIEAAEDLSADLEGALEAI